MLATIARPRTTTIFIDRILLAAEAYQIPVILVFNKKDIYTLEENAVLKEYQTLYERIGYEVLVISAFDEIDLELLKRPIKVNFLDYRSFRGGKININEPTKSISIFKNRWIKQVP